MADGTIICVDGAGWVARRHTRAFRVGSVWVGGEHPITIQSMTNTDTRDPEATLAQVTDLASLGCDIIRVAVPDKQALAALPDILRGSPLPVIADVHFRHDLAIGAIEAGIHCIRINPGTIRLPKHRTAIADCAAANGTPVRIGINSGSLEKAVQTRYTEASARALAESALQHCEFFESHGCSSLKVSLKTSRVTTTVSAYRLFAAATDYPLHIGVTEAGTERTGLVKSAVGIGTLLLEGLGDTLRVSLTASPEREIIAAQQILEATGHRSAHPEIVSCPTCGRTEVDILPLVAAVEEEIARLKAGGYEVALKKIAIMGCVVNGPGEARDADIGIAGGPGNGRLFKHGKVVAKLREDQLLPVLLGEIRGSARKSRKRTGGNDAASGSQNFC